MISTPKRLLARAGGHHHALSVSVSGFLCLSVLFTLMSVDCPAVEALKNSLANQPQNQIQTPSQGALPYTFKSGDFRLLATPSLGLDYNDNVRNSKSDKEDDFILRPLLQLNATQPLSHQNVISLNLGIGYDQYFDHSELSALRLQTGSAVSFDMVVKEVAFNFHDRMSYTRDSSQEAAVANTSDFGNFVNTAGFSVSCSLRKATLSAGYDHQNVVSGKSAFNSQDHASEMFFGRVGFEVNPELQAGFEATTAFTTYDQPTLNDNNVSSVGLFATWQPGRAFRLTPRGGYSFTHFKNTSTTLQTDDLSSYYLDLTMTHDITAAFSYGLSAGHDVRLGVQSDAVEETYVRPNVTWRAFKHASIQFGFSYEHGKQGAGSVGGLTENYDWFGGTIGTSWYILDKLTLGLNYRLTIRSSDVADRGYTQNMVGLLLTYHP
ncbi:MAG: outer membrane beta-barrel protein [Verrucomicrobia bacterium]|nr:outer membrane beta-barrel protein [Verrucomicrobiota bacterium]